MKISIAIILHKADLNGGPGHSLLHNLEYFNRQQFNYFFLVSNQGELTKKIAEKDYPVSFIKYGTINKFWPFPFLKSIWQAQSWFKKNKIQVAHFQFDFYRDPFLVAAKMAGVKVIVHVRGPAPDLKKSWLHLSDAFIYNSEFTREKSGYVQYQEYQHHVVYNAINAKLLPVKDETDSAIGYQNLTADGRQQIAGGRTIINISRIHRSKNLALFINTAAEVLKEREAKFFIIGNIQDKKYFEELKSLVEKLNLTEKIIFTGHEKDIYKWYYQADCLLHTAKEEPFGRIFLEAGLTNTPVVALNSGGAQEILEHEKTALLLDMEDPAGFKNSIFRLLDDQTLRNFLVAKNRENILKNFNPQNIQEKIEGIYWRVIND